jgi:hypothetical protein
MERIRAEQVAVASRRRAKLHFTVAGPMPWHRLRGRRATSMAPRALKEHWQRVVDD